MIGDGLVFNVISSIYEKLDDQRSKDIFIKRLNYSLSKDKGYIEQIVCSEMEVQKKKDVIKKCEAWIKAKNINTVSVFGAGFAGFQIVNALSLLGINVDKVYDNSEVKWGQKCEDITICSPKEIKTTEYIILGVNYYREAILHQLLENGMNKENIFIPDGFWWLGEYPQYFDMEIIKPNQHEVFIDGGSLDGGDSRNFVNWCEGKYDSIYAFEPDKENLDKMQVAAEEISGFEICPIGLWNKKDVLRFSSGNAENCFISEDGDISIYVDSIDNVLNGRSATFIKMDIEGSELNALDGAVNTIKKYKPKLAICVYHKPEDIIDIPLKILEMNPNYKLYLRHYSYVDTETVLYAIDEGEC
jgi:FkbM family methyltransferase